MVEVESPPETGRNIPIRDEEAYEVIKGIIGGIRFSNSEAAASWKFPRPPKHPIDRTNMN